MSDRSATTGNYPKISCLCVTRNKPEKLKMAIACFTAQSYPNKELFILYEDDDLVTKAVVSEYSSQNENITLHEVKSLPKLKLGQLRNISIQQCNGEYFCQWDDDDWYHRDRLSMQFNAAINNFHPASILTNWIIYDEANKQAYFSMFRLWEGSILCKKSLVNSSLQYPAWGKAEDSVFINLLVAKSRVYPVVAPNLYIYVIHKNNTWKSSKEHFNMLISLAQQLPASTSHLISDIVEGIHSVDEGSEFLNAPEFLNEVKYFHFNNINLSNDKLSQYMERVK